MSSFAEMLGQDVRPHAKQVQGARYLPWAMALGMAKLPSQKIETFAAAHGGSSIVRPLFGGGAVAISQIVGNRKQLIYLPITDLSNKPVPLAAITSRQAADTVNRCRARAVALVQGYGLSLYANDFNGDGPAYCKVLNVQEDTNLATVTALQEKKEYRHKVTKQVVRTQDYLGWHSALAAARITDPEFHWQIEEVEVPDQDGQMRTLPAMRLDGVGWLVGVTVTWHGASHTEWLAIMGVKTVQTKSGEKPLEHQAVDEPNVFQWHSAVMRCLAKAIAMRTGYGLASYGGDHAIGEDSDDAESSGEQTEGRKPFAEETPGSRPPEPANVRSERPEPVQGYTREVRDQKLVELRGILKELNVPEESVCAWLKVHQLEEANDMKLDTALTSAQARKRDQTIASEERSEQAPVANAA